MSCARFPHVICWFVAVSLPALALAGDAPADFRLAWEKSILTISGKHVPGGEVKVRYLEDYCRPGSTNRDWHDTTIGHNTKLIASENEGRRLRLKCTLTDGVTVSHVIQAVDDGVEFRLRVTNPTQIKSRAHWAQPCIRVDQFTDGT